MLIVISEKAVDYFYRKSIADFIKNLKEISIEVSKESIQARFWPFLAFLLTLVTFRNLVSPFGFGVEIYPGIPSVISFFFLIKSFFC